MSESTTQDSDNKPSIALNVECIKTLEDIENMAGLIENLKGCVTGIDETKDILGQIGDANFCDVDSEFTDRWDVTIVYYYSKCSPKVRELAYNVLSSYCKKEDELKQVRKKLKTLKN